ncbi:MAG: hypothetical protein ABJE95_06120 [Byssovorax sp.]
MRHFLPLLAVVVLAPCLALSPAFAAPPPGPTAAEIAARRDPHVRATELLDHGTDLSGRNQCEQAVIPLDASWALEKNPTTAQLLGECEIKLARWVPAARHLAFVLKDKEEGAERARLDALFKQARAQVGGVMVQTSVDGADVFAGSRIVGITPLRYEIFVEPGDTMISLKKTSVGEVQQLVHVDKGSSTTIRLEPAKAPVDDDRPHAPEVRSRAPIFVLAGVAVAAAGAGLGLRVVGGSKGSAANDALAGITTAKGGAPCELPANAAVCATIKDDRVKHDTFVNASTGLFVLGGAALAASITYALWPTEGANRERPIAVLPAVSPGAGGLLVQGTF